MNLRVKAIALTLLTLTFLAGGVSAFAEDDNDDDNRPAPRPTSSSSSSEYPKPHRTHAEENELHDRYGDDIGQVNLPPLVVKDPPAPGPGAVIKPGAVTGAATTGNSEKFTNGSVPKQKLVKAGNANPSKNIPVDPTSIVTNQRTPADNFFNIASAGIGFMGIGVAILVAFAVGRSIQMRRDSKSNF